MHSSPQLLLAWLRRRVGRKVLLSPLWTMSAIHESEGDALAALRTSLSARVMHLTPGGGLHRSQALPALMYFRSDTSHRKECPFYEPCVALALQGAKRVVVGDTTLVYDERRYLLTLLDLPAVATILDASPQRPYLALVLRLNLREIADLMLSAPMPQVPLLARDSPAAAIGDITLPLLDAFRRLLDLADRPQDVPVLAPLVQREILYRLLMGEAGGRLRQIVSVDGQGQQIARAIERLKTSYSEPLRVEDLATAVRMSVSTFHHRFKALTGMSPLQYQKRLRLTEARRLMLVEHLDASTAAYRVGYESPSQFSREYGRQFGAPPTRDIALLQAVPEEALGP